MKESALQREVRLGALLADLKEDHYRLWLLVSALIERLDDEGLLDREELRSTAERLAAEDNQVMLRRGAGPPS